MNINDALAMMSESDVIIGIDNVGNMKLIKSNSNNQVKCFADGLNILFDLFNQETEIEYFNEAFRLEFHKLILNHMKRMDFNGREIISAGEGLWASTG
jgi:hypothetical protein